jgi:hypothetical protein
MMGSEDEGTRHMGATKHGGSRQTTKRPKTGRSGKKKSFRDLKAFGLWAERPGPNDPIAFTGELRKRAEQRIYGR